MSYIPPSQLNEILEGFDRLNCEPDLSFRDVSTTDHQSGSNQSSYYIETIEPSQHAPSSSTVSVGPDAINCHDDCLQDASNDVLALPQKLPSCRHWLSSISVDCLLLMSSLLFPAFALVVYRKDGKTTSNADDLAARLNQAGNLGTTIFPYLFAAVTSRFLKAVAMRRMQDGIRASTLAHLTSATTIVRAITTPFQIRSFGMLAITIIALWSLSPIGSQGILRVLSVHPRTLDQSRTLFWLDTQMKWPWDMADESTGKRAVNSLFSASLLIPPNVQASAVDSWGNVKIPMIELLPGFDEAGFGTTGYLWNNSSKNWKIASPGLSIYNNTYPYNYTLIPTNYMDLSLSGYDDIKHPQERWIDVNGGDPSIYSSLIGVPMSNKAALNDSTIVMNVTYLYMDCYNMTHTPTNVSNLRSNLTNVQDNSIASNGMWSLLDTDYTILPPHAANTPYTTASGDKSGPSWMTLSVLSELEGGFAANELIQLYCKLTQSAVEIRMNCTASLLTPCRAVSARWSSPWTPGTAPASDSDSTRYVGDLLTAVPFTHIGDSSPIEQYLANPSGNLFSNYGLARLGNTDAKTLGHRFSQLMNTYRLAGIAPASITGSLNISGNGTDAISKEITIRHGTMTIFVHDHYFHCNKGWLLALLLASCILILDSISSAILRMCTLGPDILGLVSALTAKYPITASPVGSYLDDNEKVRMLGDLRIRIGDAEASEAIGYIAISNIDKVEPLSQGRLYR